MKKILLCILLICAIASMVVVTSFADDVTYYNGFAPDGEISVSYHEYSSFTLSVPTSIDPYSDSIISVISADMEDGMGIVVSITNLNADGTITLTNTTDATKTVKASIYANNGYVNYDDPVLANFTSLNLSNGALPSVLISPRFENRAPKAGDYTGVICYHIDCIPL